MYSSPLCQQRLDDLVNGRLVEIRVDWQTQHLLRRCDSVRELLVRKLPLSIGLLLMQAIKGRDEGKTISENAAYLRQIAPDIGFWFMVEDLEYLKRGGRVSATAAFAGNVLNLKPVLKINDEGKLINISKQRGVQRAVKYLLECYEGSYDDTISSDVIVAHAVCKERAEKMRDEILRINPGAKVQICPMGPVIGSHTGPGFAAIIHFGNRNFR